MSATAASPTILTDSTAAFTQKVTTGGGRTTP